MRGWQLTAMLMLVPVGLTAADRVYGAKAAGEVGQRVRQWIQMQPGLDDALRAELLGQWELGPESRLAPDQLLWQTLQTRARLQPAWQQFLTEANAGQPSLAIDRFLADADRDPFWASNARLHYGRLLAEQRFYDEALAVLQTVDPHYAIDPAALFFFTAVSAQGILQVPAALDAAEKLLDGTAGVPQRYISAATLLQAELQKYESKSLDEVSRLMSDSERRLELGRAGEPVRDVQERIVATLDELIKKIEAQQGGGGGGGNGGNSNESSAPAEDSVIKGSTAPGEVEKKKFSKEGRWGDLPEKQQAEAKNLINRNFPSHYRQAIETYFKKLAGRPAAPEK